MQRSVNSYLADLISAASDIDIYIQGFTEQTFAEDGRTQAAVERKFEIMGEALVQARRLYLPAFRKTPDRLVERLARVG